MVPPDLSVASAAGPPPGITVQPTRGLTTTTSGGKATFTVVLDSPPVSEVDIGLASSDETQGTVAPTHLTFGPIGWDQPQTITVTGADDMVLNGNHLYTIVLSPAGSTDSNYSGIDPADVTVTNLETDVAAVIVDPLILTTTPGLLTGSFTLRLETKPSANVTVGLSAVPAYGTLSAASVTFTPESFATPQKITVTGIDDLIFDGPQLWKVVTAPAESTDADYNAIDPPDVTVTNVEVDVAGIVVNPTSGLQTAESGSSLRTATFTVVLKSKPTANVNVPVTTSNATHGTVNNPSPLVFTPANWNVAQTVTITGQDDSTIDPPGATYTINVGVASSSDTVYAGIDPPDVTVNIIDTDTATILVSRTSLFTAEQGGPSGSDSFVVSLSTLPAAAVSMTVSSSDTTCGTISGSPVTLNSGNWNTGVTVTVIGHETNTVKDGAHSYSVSFGNPSSSDTNYNGAAKKPSSIPASNADDDVNVYATDPMVWCLGPGATLCDGANLPVGIYLGATVNFLANQSDHSIVSTSPGSSNIPSTAAGFPTAATPSATGSTFFFCGVHGTGMGGTLTVSAP